MDDMTTPPLKSPHGARIRVPVPVALTMLARLLPDVRPFYVLLTVDAYYNIVAVYTGFALAACLYVQATPLATSIATFVVGTVVDIKQRSGRPIGTVSRLLALLYADFNFGVCFPFVVIIAAAWYFGSWQHILAFILARIVFFVLHMVLNFRWSRWVRSRFNESLTWQERYFFDAYLAAAIKVGIEDPGAEVTQEELESGAWLMALEDIRKESPEYAERLVAI